VNQIPVQREKIEGEKEPRESPRLSRAPRVEKGFQSVRRRLVRGLLLLLSGISESARVAIATTIAVSAPASPLSGGLMPLAGANAPPAMDGFDAVFSAILSQIADGAVGNNQPQAAILAVANDAGIPAIQPSAAGADIAADGSAPLPTAPVAADPSATLPAMPVAPLANDTKQISTPVPANIAAAVSLLEAQSAPAVAPKTMNSAPASDAQRPAPKQNAKSAPTQTTDISLLTLTAPVPVAPPVAPVAPVAPEAAIPADGAAPLAPTAPNAAPPALPPVSDADGDEPDDAPPAAQTSGAGALTASTDQSVAAANAGDFVADLKSSLSQAAQNEAPAANGAQFTAPAARKAAPAQTTANASAAQTNALSQKTDANAAPLAQLAAKDQDSSSGNQKSATAATSQQASAPATQPAALSPSPATLSNTADNSAASSALAAQQPGQTNALTPAVALHVAPQTGPHAATTSDLDSLGVAIAAKSLDGIKHFDIRLDPPELGRVEVRLSVGDDGKAQASLSVDRPQTLQLLQNDASNLNRALKDAGLNLSDSGLSFSLRGQDRQASDGGASQQKGRSLSVRALASIDAASQVSSNAYSTLSPDSAGVDIRV
jgi:flagellar hook-length control protein FliK